MVNELDAARSRRAPLELTLRKKLAFASIAFSFCAVVAYSLWCVGWSWSVYRYVKDQKRGWRGNVHQADAALGYASIPGSVGQQTFAIGPDLPIHYDEHGFRVPPVHATSSDTSGPCILTLGCSFTFGDSCPAEETFAYRLEDQLHGHVLNAGKCSYGLAQMVLLARELIPRHHPKIVVAQFSPWLLDRSMTCYLPAYYGVIPGPYFAERGGKLEIAPPVFAWDARDFGNYRETPKSASDFLKFAAGSAIPLRIHDDLGRTATRLWQCLGATPVPCRDRDRVVEAGYGELLRLCQAAQAQLVIVVLGSGIERVEVPPYLAELGVPVARPHDKLIDDLHQQDEESYRRAYANWRGDPPRMVDTHPNAAAHAVIAQAIVDAVRQVPGEPSMAREPARIVR